MVEDTPIIIAAIVVIVTTITISVTATITTTTTTTTTITAAAIKITGTTIVNITTLKKIMEIVTRAFIVHGRITRGDMSCKV
eukprot:CAMPEP_0175069116 /NCGR_PEP_ID=MMETSP0052_2-20121109/18028_1 /TAXON_ID=51329 ORGANISM="Polytomella parva, Strain SAG 63-3" /NCGR_SAMPLE_ID=MMETSP0052_2 /ASSEMBLY_ACC=CAM_ASM_000194 /LENGTH=81 /DNA_ID=CAMNT_0016336179 /DNA_START=688 /DNA_END=933 /DNA_ORIENTATION=+